MRKTEYMQYCHHYISLAFSAVLDGNLAHHQQAGTECAYNGNAHDMVSMGVTHIDNIPNTILRYIYGVALITDKRCECQLRWFGHVMRQTEEVAKKRDTTAMTIKKKLSSVLILVI